MAEGTRRLRADAENDNRSKTVGSSYETTDAVRGLVDDLLATAPTFKELTIADSGAVSETPLASKGVLIVNYESGGSSDDVGTVAAIAFYNADSGTVNEIASGSVTTLNTSSLSGTTGTAGDFTIGIQSDGTIDFENQTTASITVRYATIGV